MLIGWQQRLSMAGSATAPPCERGGRQQGEASGNTASGRKGRSEPSGGFEDSRGL